MMEAEKKEELKESVTTTVVETAKEHTETASNLLKDKIKSETNVGKKILYGVLLAIVIGVGSAIGTYGSEIVNYIFSLF